MGKRSFASNPAVIELEREEGIAQRCSKRRALQVSSNTAAMSLLAMRSELPAASSEEDSPMNKLVFPLGPQRQAKSVEYTVSSITDDEDENAKSTVVACKKRPNALHVGPSLTLLALRKPTLSIVGKRRLEAVPTWQLPFGRPLPPAPLLPRNLLVMPLTIKS
jgi:hypothetical protein